MKKYKINVDVTVIGVIEVEAELREEAEVLAQDLARQASFVTDDDIEHYFEVVEVEVY